MRTPARQPPHRAWYAVAFVYSGVFLLLPLGSLLASTLRLAPGVCAAIVTWQVWRPVLLSLALAGVAALVHGLLAVVLGPFLAYENNLQNKLPWQRHVRRTLDRLVDLPLSISPVMAGLAIVLMFGRNGWFFSVLRPWHVRVVFSYLGLQLATLVVTVPYTLREVIYLLREAGDDEEEAAETLGASAWTTLRTVSLPKMAPALAHGISMTISRALGEFGAVLVVGGSIAGQTQTATTLIHDALQERQPAVALAVTGTLLCISALVVFVLEKRLAARYERMADTTSE